MSGFNSAPFGFASFGDASEASARDPSALFALPATYSVEEGYLHLLYGLHAGELVPFRDLQCLHPGKLLAKALYTEKGAPLSAAMLRHPEISLWRLLNHDPHTVRLVDLRLVDRSDLDRVLDQLDADGRKELLGAYELEHKHVSLQTGRC